MAKRWAWIGLLLISCQAICFQAAAFNTQQLLENRLDPEVSYETLETPHFSIHYSDDLEDLANHIAPIAERVQEKVSKALRWSPTEKTNIVLVHHTDEPDIFTFVYPHPQIFLDAALPLPSLGINDYGDWYEWVLTHEYTHVVHLDRREGWYAPLSSIFGSSVRPDEYTPVWMKEGLAVYLESELTSHGRGGSNYYRMMMRMAVEDEILDDADFASPDTIASYEKDTWPWTIRPYLFGYYLMRTLHRDNDQNLAALIHDTASSFPFLLDASISAANGKSFDSLWTETLDQIKSESLKELQELKREPQTDLDYLTNTGQIYAGLALTKNGRSLFATRDQPGRDNAILRFDLDEDQVSAPVYQTDRATGYQTSVSASSRFLAFDQESRAKRYYLISDIYLYDLKSAQIISVSPYLSARDPDIAPDGTHVVFVTNDKGKNKLILTDTNWDNPVDLLGDVGYSRLSGPRFSPDGTKLVLSVHNETTGGEDLWLVDSREKKVLLEDGARNIHASWTPDGQQILYSSDRSGVANIYCLDLQTEQISRLTHVLGGLFYPVVDPKRQWIYVVSYRGRGYDIARFRWDPASRKTDVATESEGVSTSPKDTQTAYADTKTPIEKSPTNPHEYQASRDLLPQFLKPAFLLRPGDLQIGLETGATDPLFFQNYDIDVRYDTSTNGPVGEFYYFNGRASVAWDLNVVGDAYPLAFSNNQLRTLNAVLAAEIPLATEDQHLFLRPGPVYQRIDAFGTDQYLGVQLGVRYNTEFKQIGYSFPESGSYVDVTAMELFATDTRQPLTSLQIKMRTHIPLFWSRNALHLEFNGGTYLAGPLDENDFFVAGGQDSFPFSLGSAFMLYGYPVNSVYSPTLGVGTALYTFPIWEVQRGIGTSAIYFGRLSGGLRAQVADGKDLGSSGLPWSFGGELHQALLAAHVHDLDAQLGVYRGATAFGGETQLFFMLSLGDEHATSAASAGAQVSH